MTRCDHCGARVGPLTSHYDPLTCDVYCAVCWIRRTTPDMVPERWLFGRYLYRHGWVSEFPAESLSVI